ncbi:MAG: rhodanese-like domain-containing protein [Cocleimonas sp.]|nr:rhodanese-like domain-containing protein [Cocleimonas sp.]
MKKGYFKTIIVFRVFIISLAVFPQLSFSKDEPTKSPEGTLATTDDQLKVRITEDMPYLDVAHEGKIIRIKRIQNPANILKDSYSLTSRQCPPFCVRPIKIAEGVKTVGEIEVLHFLKEEVRSGNGLLIDARLTEWNKKGTIPGSISIPFTLFSNGAESLVTLRLLKLLGVTEDEDEELIFDKAMTLVLFCNGLWCGQSPKAISYLLGLGYPAEKLHWYRGGMQAWLYLGLTIIKPSKNDQ